MGGGKAMAPPGFEAGGQAFWYDEFDYLDGQRAKALAARPPGGRLAVLLPSLKRRKSKRIGA